MDKIPFHCCNPLEVQEDGCLSSRFRSGIVSIPAVSRKIEAEASLLPSNLLSLVARSDSRVIEGGCRSTVLDSLEF